MARYVARAGLYSNIRQRVTNYRVEVNTKILDSLDSRTRRRISDATKKTVLDIEGTAKTIAREKDIIDTGFMINSIEGLMISPFLGEVTVGAFYGIYHEFGTVKVPARPFLGPAVDKHKNAYMAAVRQAVREAAAGS